MISKAHEVHPINIKDQEIHSIKWYQQTFDFNNWQQVGVFIPTYKTKHKCIFFFTQTYKTIQTGRSF